MKMARIKKGWDNEGLPGLVLGPPIMVGQLWTPILWLTDVDPDFFKTAGLEFYEASDGEENTI